MGRAGNGRKVCALGVAGVLAGTVLVGCGDGARDSAAGGSTREDGTRAVRSAYDRTAEEDTAKVRLQVRTSAQGASETANGQGAVDLDDGDSVMTLTVQGQRIEQRVVDQVLYQKMPNGQAPGGKPWIRIDLGKISAEQGAGDRSMSDPAQSAAYAKAITDKDVTKKGTAAIDGVETTHYGVSVDVAKLPGGDALRRQVGPTLPMDVWLDEEGRMRRQQIDMTLKAAPGSTERSSTDSSSSPQRVTVRTVMDFTDFGTEVEADAPPAGQVTDMTGKALEQGKRRS
ncbi:MULTISPECIES: hypothetical protein [Streptomyces]|uniref:Lipoprotein n=1 Tax=Streptomyces chartreusis NRRL 3882 TaxID=1079985 RepID=A0A2N9B0C2_STRCX|nr:MULTISPECIES: hypothetical protein [Streptomyces]MYS91018.1 hypothetical protein [Streptomyces sp. SID5464]SOR76773.1 hypothetical protein SCNRRL3882_0254 [Streptomyces chartreusis NRRL 3882]